MIFSSPVFLTLLETELGVVHHLSFKLNDSISDLIAWYVRTCYVLISFVICTRGLLSFVTSPAGAVAKYCDEYVCLSVCLSARISQEPHARSLPNFVHVAYVRGSVLLRYVDDRPHRLLAGRG